MIRATLSELAREMISTGLTLAPWVVRSLALLISCSELEIDDGTARRNRRGGSPATTQLADVGVHNT